MKVSKVSIGETGRVEGSVHAESIEIRGRVSGEVTAKQVRLYNTAHVEGDITHEQLAMEVGAFFQGRSIRFQRQGGHPGEHHAHGQDRRALLHVERLQRLDVVGFGRHDRRRNADALI